MPLLLKKISYPSTFLLRSFQVTQLLKGRKIWLELKRGDCFRVQAERVKLLSCHSRSQLNLKFGYFTL